MDRFQGNTAGQTATTPVTDSARFVITARDVGSDAIRPGIAAQLEQERAVLLLAAKLVLGRIRAGQVGIGAAYEHALATAIKAAEAR
jgi:hypothetical protein